jgi:hypothetical protein
MIIKRSYIDMSKFNKCILVGAIALAVSGTAFAVGSTTATNSQFAWNLTGGTAPNPTADTGAVAFSVAAPDILIGRSSGTGQITVEAVITGGALDAALTAGDIAPQGTAVVNTVSATAGATAFQFTMTPPAAPGFAAGSLFTIDALELRSATGIAALGGNVSITFTIRDTTTGTILSSASAAPVLTSVEATAVANSSGSTRTIDVFPPSLKRNFSGAPITVATLGTVTVSQRDTAPAAGIQPASGLGSSATNNVAGGLFVYDVAADEVDLTLTVPNAGGFQGAGNGFFADTAACSDPASGSAVAFTVDPGDATKYVASAPITATTGVTYNICAVASGTAEIAAQTIGLSSQVNLAGALTKDAAAVNTANFATLSFNGPVVVVQSFNPASNSAVDSLLRVLNTSNTAGLVSIDSVCQNGQVRGPISFTLIGKNQVQYSSAELESGTAGAGKPTLSGGLGACTAGGRSQLTITGQIPTMEVQNFLRSTTTAGVITAGNNNDE